MLNFYTGVMTMRELKMPIDDVALWVLRQVVKNLVRHCAEVELERIVVHTKPKHGYLWALIGFRPTPLWFSKNAEELHDRMRSDAPRQRLAEAQLG